MPYARDRLDGIHDIQDGYLVSRPYQRIPAARPRLLARELGPHERLKDFVGIAARHAGDPGDLLRRVGPFRVAGQHYERSQSIFSRFRDHVKPPTQFYTLTYRIARPIIIMYVEVYV